MKKIVVFASGSGTNAENIIKYFALSEIGSVVAVFTNNATAKVIERAKNNKIPTEVFSKEELFESKAENEKLYTLLKALKSKNSDLVSVGDGVIELEKKLVDAKTELQKYKEEIGYCPLCNSKL